MGTGPHVRPRGGSSPVYARVSRRSDTAVNYGSMTAALSITALAISILTFALNFRAARLAERRARMPVLVFEWQPQANQWVLRNVGGGPRSTSSSLKGRHRRLAVASCYSGVCMSRGSTPFNSRPSPKTPTSRCRGSLRKAVSVQRTPMPWARFTQRNAVPIDQ